MCLGKVRTLTALPPVCSPPHEGREADTSLSQTSAGRDEGDEYISWCGDKERTEILCSF